MMGEVTAGQFGEKRDPRQTLLEAVKTAGELETVIVVKVHSDPRAIQVSWSDADKLVLLGALTIAMAQVREFK